MNKFSYKIEESSDDFSIVGNKVNLKNKTYTWGIADCGKHVKLSRGKSPKCAQCVQDGHIDFLKSKGVEVLDRVSANSYLVRLKCGHDKIVKPDESNFSHYCKECRDVDVLKRCPDGTKIKGYFKKGQRVELELPCGHFTVRKTYGSDKITCLECRAEAKQRMLLETATIDNGNNTYTLSCGHTTGDIDWTRLRDYKCLSCEREQIQKRGLVFGLTPTGNYNSLNKTHEFILPCGHSKYMRSTAIKAGVVCPICAEDHLNKPCDMYFLIGFSEGFTFLKIGVANDTNVRIKDYRNKKKISWMLMASVGFSSKRDALKVEKLFHKDNFNKRLDPERMREYLTEGFTECYPMELLPTLSEYISDLHNQYGYSVHFKK